MALGTVLAIWKTVAHVRAVVNTLKGINQGETTTVKLNWNSKMPALIQEKNKKIQIQKAELTF